MKPVKVLFIPYLSGLEGSERSLLTLVSGLQSTGGIEPVVLSPKEGPLTSRVREAGVTVMIHRYFGWIGKRFRVLRAVSRIILNVCSLALLSPRIRSLKPDIVYTNTLATPFGAMIALLCGFPHIWHAREFVHEDMNWTYDFGTRLSMALVRRSDRVICNSAAVKEKMAKTISSNRLHVVYNGFTFDEKGVTREKYDASVDKHNGIPLLVSGSVHPGKGQEDAVRALAVLVARGHNVRLSIAGSGQDAYISFLKSLSRQAGVEDRVYWCGFVEDTSSLLAEAAVVLVCSRSEAFGRVAVEAMAAGTPVVGTDRGGIPEIIENNRTGLLYQPGDHLGLAERIERLLTDPEFYTAVIQHGRRSALSRFNVEQYVSGVRKIIEDIVGQNQ